MSATLIGLGADGQGPGHAADPRCHGARQAVPALHGVVSVLVASAASRDFTSEEIALFGQDSVRECGGEGSLNMLSSYV